MDNKFYETNEEVRASIEAVREPLFGGYQTLPVLSSGQWAGSAHPTYAALHTTDLLMLAGGGVHAHPGGRAAGVRSLRQAWDAATAGVALDDHAREHAELAQAPRPATVLATKARRNSALSTRDFWSPAAP